MAGFSRTQWSLTRVSASAWVAVAAIALLPMRGLCADQADPLNDSFGISLGTFLANTTTTANLNGTACERRCASIDWSKNFGEDNTWRGRLDGFWRFTERQDVRFVVFNANHNNTRTINHDIEWGDSFFPAGSSVKSDYTLWVYELAYEYAFLKRDTYSVAGLFGVHWETLTMKLHSHIIETGQTYEYGDSARLNAPLPVFGVSAIKVFPHDLSLYGAAQFFALTYDNYSGNLQDYRFLFNWQPRKWLGIGVGYDYFRLHVDVSKPTFSGSAEASYGGPMIFYNASF